MGRENGLSCSTNKRDRSVRKPLVDDAVAERARDLEALYLEGLISKEELAAERARIRREIGPPEEPD